jgi:hypothetical protein
MFITYPSAGTHGLFPRSRRPLGRGPAAEFKPARLTRSETVSLLDLDPILAHALLAFFLPVRLPNTIISGCLARSHSTYLSLLTC